MKYLVFIAFIALVGCNDKSKMGFTSGDCGEVYTNCLNRCTHSGRTRVDCLTSCERSRGMCESIKVKGCMQNCNKAYGKDSTSSENCRRTCAENRGASR